jgi:virginiamycin A acetyltransferase
MNEISSSAKISTLADIECSVRGSRLMVGDGVTIDSFVKIKFVGGSGNIVIGPDSYLNSGVVIYSGNGVQIGRGVLVAANTTFAATNHEYRMRDKTIIDQRHMVSKGGIVVEDDCWIGANCVLLDGTILRRGCVVAAGTVVRREWSEYAVIGGEPPKVLYYRTGSGADPVERK